MSARRQLCTFRLGDLYLGVDARQVQEVLTHRPMTRVPLAPPEVRGLINLRGQIVPAVDLRRRLELPPAAETALNVVIRHEGGAVSFLVDEIGDVIDVDEANFEPLPETLGGVAPAAPRRLQAGGPLVAGAGGNRSGRVEKRDKLVLRFAMLPGSVANPPEPAGRAAEISPGILESDKCSRISR